MVRKRGRSLISNALFGLTLLYALAVVAWLVGRAVWGDGYLVLAVINSFPTAPFVFVPLAVLAAILDRRPATVAAALIPLALWLVLFGWRFLPRPRSVEAGTPVVRVMAFNVLWNNEDVEAIAGAIRSAGADLVTLPELTVDHDAALAQRIGGEYPYRVLSRLPNAGFGVAIYSRWPLRNLGSLQTGLGLRSAAVDVQTPYGDVRFVGAHPRATEGTRASVSALFERLRQSFRGREAQVAAICEQVAAWGDRPLILAGDFNMSEFSDAYRCVAGSLRDAYKAAGRGYGFTWPGGIFDQGWLRRLVLQTRIDFVFHSRHFRAADARVLRVHTGSDHWPATAVLALVDD